MTIKNAIKQLPIVDKLYIGKRLYMYYRNEYPDISLGVFLIKNIHSIKNIRRKNNKIDQLVNLVNSVHINTDSITKYSFFYNVDPFTKAQHRYQLFDNYSIDYSWVVNSSFDELMVYADNTEYQKIVNALKAYVNRLRNLLDDDSVVEEIISLFTRPAEHFHEAIQRILFINQWIWQSGHKNIGLGHLDWILYQLYRADIDSGYISEDDARNYLCNFFNVLHEEYWFKSAMLLGDTGQIVILGGLGDYGEYRCNDLTYLFIEISKKLKLPDPKVLLRVSKEMPEDLLTLAIECISTGIGSPLLSNDDEVVPALIQFGYKPEDAFDYATSACWEPLTIGKSCDQNNIKTFNFCNPFSEFIDSDEFVNCKNINDVLSGYYASLSNYTNQFLSELDEKVFEEDPILTLFTPEVLKTGKDIVGGGAKYANLGVTSVGLSTVVNSLLNLDKFVFEDEKYTLHNLDEIRRNNYERNEELRKELDKGMFKFGEDNARVIVLTNDILLHVSGEFHKHHTKLGGEYKFGLSSPHYIVEARNIDATFDGRKAGMPFNTHISGKNGLPPTELMSFASQLDFHDNRINGNVVDFIMTPMLFRKNMDKVVTMIKGAIKQGVYQMQINVIDSKTLIEAQKNPERFPNLVVRVWGFSAYFKDLPKEYQDNLIRRTIEAEQVG